MVNDVPEGSAPKRAEEENIKRGSCNLLLRSRLGNAIKTYQHANLR